MGFLDSIESMAGGAGQQDNARVAGGMMQAVQEHPGGLQGVLDTLRQNGMGQHVQNWTQGQPTPVAPEQVQQGLAGTGLIDSIAAKAGVSPQVAQIAMATLLPLAIAHFTRGGQPAGEGEMGGLAQQFLGKFL